MKTAKNSTFLFERNFMDYHSDRFFDFSLMIYKDGKLVALLPANKKEAIVYSHQGLSYGGLLIPVRMQSEHYFKIMITLLNFLKNKGISELLIKEVPSIYNKQLSGEFDYFIQHIPHKVVETNSYYVNDNQVPYKPNRNRKRAITKAKGLLCITNSGLKEFWKGILEVNLKTKFNVLPVHSFEEISLLQTNFKNEIEFVGVSQNDELQAGAVLFITDQVVHFQYSSGRENRSETNALDFLFDSIIKKYQHKKFISFGSSATDKTLIINKGLAYWKESLGAQLIPQKSYSINTSTKLKIEAVIK